MSGSELNLILWCSQTSIQKTILSCSIKNFNQLLNSINIMIRFNILYLTIQAYHKLAFSFSPIDRERFEAQIRERCEQNKEGLSRLEERYTFESYRFPMNKPTEQKRSNKRGLIWILSHPIQVINLISKYHMIKRRFIILQLIHTLFLVHILIKALVYTLIVGKDRSKSEYLNSVYYIHLASYFSKPHLFDGMIFCYSIIFLVVKVMRFSELISRSICNENKYQKMFISQLNCTSLATLKLTLSEWIDLYKATKNHAKSGAHENHDTFHASTQRKLPDLSDMEALFYCNMLDFDSCYKAESSLPDTRKRLENIKDWHCSLPLDRLSLVDLRHVIELTLFGTPTVLVGCILMFFAIIYLELKSDFPLDYTPTILELIHQIPPHFTTPLYLVRTIEVLLVLASQVPLIYDQTLIFLDVLSTTSRGLKLSKVINKYLEFSHNEARNFAFESNRSTHLPVMYCRPSYFVLRELNKDIRKNVALARLLYLEFLKVREENSRYTIYVLGNGICMAWTLVVMLQYKNFAESSIFVSAFLSNLISAALLLVYCVRLESMVGT